MSPRALSVLVLASLLGAAGLALALTPRPAPVPREAAARTQAAERNAAAPFPVALQASVAPLAPSATSRLALLPPLRIQYETTRELRDVKLYDARGQLDESAAAQLDALLCDARQPKHRENTRLNRRTLQLLFKAAYHFQSYEVEVVSAYRKPGRRSEGPHGTGDAIDFRLHGVNARALASYLRELPRTGVGVYTHPKTQYVHLDSREHSFHWLDASPPRRHWREKSIGAPDLAARDRRYTHAGDLPDGFDAPPAVTAANGR
jgi:uncharacterized protein YcbK (DUF882 family)